MIKGIKPYGGFHIQIISQIANIKEATAKANTVFFPFPGSKPRNVRTERIADKNEDIKNISDNNFILIFSFTKK